MKTAIKKKLYTLINTNLIRNTESGDKKRLKSNKNRVSNSFLLLNSYWVNYSLISLTQHSLSTLFTEKVDIRLTPNNIFCTYTNLRTNKIVLNGSSGKYKIQTSRKRLKTASKSVLDIFFNKLKKEKASNISILNLTAPISLRKRLIRRLLKQAGRKKKLFLKINPNKCFNGCRASKRRRKKSLRVRFYK